MYLVSIINGNTETVIHDFNSAASSQRLAAGSIVDAVNSISSFSFKIYPNNAGYDLLNAYATKVKVYNSRKSRYDFIGRVLQVNPSMDSNGLVCKDVVCEDRMGYLQDSVQPYTELHQYAGDDSRTGLQEFIDALLANHNSQVENDKKIYRGTVDVQTYDSSDGVYKQLNWESTFDDIKKKLLDVFGGYIRIRESEGTLYLDYLTEIGSTRSTTIELAKNMVSVQKDVNASEIVTRLVPLGAKKTVVDSEGNETETEERLTIANVNDGKIYIESDSYVQQFGIRYKTVVWDDVTDASNLLRKGQGWLAENNGLTLNHDIDAIDLSLIGLAIDDFALYDSYPVKNELVGISDILRIIKKNTNIVEPQNSSFEMGTVLKRLSDSMIDATSLAQSAITEASATATNLKNSVVTLRTFVSESIASYRVDPDQIWAAVQEHTVNKSDYETFSSYVKNILQMDADGTTMLFQKITDAINDVGTAESTHHAELLTYIGFSEDGIRIGKEGNAITMNLDNDSLNFYNNGTRVAYMTDNTLHITDGRFLRSLRIGNFGFIPESNGSVSFTYLGGDN